MLLTSLMYALFGSVFTAAKLGLEQAEPFFMLAVRMSIAGAAMLVFQLLRSPKLLKLEKRHLMGVLSLTLFNVYLTNGLEFWGMQYLTSSKTSLLYSLTPFIAALLSFLFFGEVLSRRKWLGLLVGFAGFLPILYQQGAEELGLSSLGFISSAELAMIGAATCQVLGMMSMQRLMNMGSISVITANAYSMFGGGIIALVHSLATENWQPIPLHGRLDWFLEAVLWMVVISSFICYNIWGYLLRHYTVTFIAFSGFMTPFFAALASWLVIDEHASLSFWISAMIVFSGLAVFYSEELKEEGIELDTGTGEPLLTPS